jgi:hypothetical protein
MLDHPIEFSAAQHKDQPPDRRTYYGHPKRLASQCCHNIHTSAPEHTPLCPGCVFSRAKRNMDIALNELIAKGGPTPTTCVRDRRWQMARLRYRIAKQRQTEVRKRDQLRVERELAWEEAHQRSHSQPSQAAAIASDFMSCPVCASMAEPYPVDMPKFQTAKDTAWWERPCAQTDHFLVPRTTPRPVKEPRKYWAAKGSPKLRQLIQDFRSAMSATDAQRQAWEITYRTETAVRRKHNLDESFHFEPEFWGSPISGLTSRQHYQSILDSQRMAARRARGNAPRPKPPCSSLSYSEHREETAIDEKTLEEMREREEKEYLERETRKVGGEVGYLYFVGAVDGLMEWREEYLISDRQLVYRKQVQTVLSDSEQSETCASESEDSEAEDLEQEEGDADEMEIDG